MGLALSTTTYVRQVQMALFEMLTIYTWMYPITFVQESNANLNYIVGQ